MDFNKIKRTKEKVEFLLKLFPHLRDDDYRLISSFYLYESGGRDVLKNISALDFLQEFSKGKFTSPESIRRMRAKVQEENIELRGEKYEERQIKGNEYSKNIKYV